MESRTHALRRIESYLRGRGIPYGFFSEEYHHASYTLNVRSNWAEPDKYGGCKDAPNRYLYITEQNSHVELFWGPKYDEEWRYYAFYWDTSGRPSASMRIDVDDHVRILTVLREILHEWLGWA